MITFLKLTEQDKSKLKKLAQTKNLSMSTCANIIAKHLFFFVSNEQNYYKEGNTQTTIKIRNECNFEYNTMKITNCIILYFNHEHLNKNILTKTNENDFWKHQNKIIQKELDKTIDVNKNLNEEIRAYYRAKHHLERAKA